MSDPLKPSPTLLCKLGSILVHAEELTSPSGHIFDHEALKSAWDEEVNQWMEQMGKSGFLPVRR
jgi:hypothetical protein